MATLGNHMKMQAAEGLEERVRTLYRDILGCRELPGPMPNVDLFQFTDGFVLGVFYVPANEAPTDSECFRGTWLEIMTDDVEALRQRLLEFGVAEIDYPDKSHFYFHAPGGAVFRLAPETERVPRAT